MKNTRRIYLLLVVTTAAWGSLYVANKFVLGYLPTFTILFVRYLIASVSMTVILRVRKPSHVEKPIKIEPQDRKYVVLLGLGGYVAAVAFQQVGTRIAGASPASLINAMNPIFIVLLAVCLLHEKLTFQKIVCVISAVTGAACIVGGGVAGSHIAGVLFSLLSVLVWSLVSVTVRRVTQRYDPLTLTTYGIYIATLFTLPLCAWEVAATPGLALLQPKLLLPLLYLGTVCTAGAHTLWNYCLSRLEASTCALFYPIQPLTSMTLGILLLHEKITGAFLLGAALILGGVLYSSLGGTKRKTA